MKREKSLRPSWKEKDEAPEQEGCACMRAMVKRGWVQHRTPSSNPDGDRKYFIVVTKVPNPDGPGTVGLILQKCFVCGRDIYPK